MECKMSLVRALDMTALSAKCSALSMVYFLLSEEGNFKNVAFLYEMTVEVSYCQKWLLPVSTSLIVKASEISVWSLPVT